MELIERLLGNKPLAETRPSEALTGSSLVFEEAARGIVRILLAEQPESMPPVSEASVHRSKRSAIWVAAFTGPTGGQRWRSTGLTDRVQALLLARHWEAEAREQRARLGRTAKRPIWHVRRPGNSTRIGPLTQKEVALLLTRFTQIKEFTPTAWAKAV